MARGYTLKTGYKFTPGRAKALARARAISAKNRHRARIAGNKRTYGKRPVGLSGLKKNFIPYTRVNKNSQTAGFNAGSIVPGTKKRIVVGAYVRVERTSRSGGLVDRAVSKVATSKIVAPPGTRRGNVRQYITKNVAVTNPAVRFDAPTKNVQARLGSSRGAGPTLIVRRGRHKTPRNKSKQGIKKYDDRMRTIQKTKATNKRKRPQRRGK